jgi:hypothetical protein
MRLTLPLPKYDGDRSLLFFDALVERASALPDVAAVSLSNQPPPGVFSRAQFRIEGRPPASPLPSAFFTTAGSRYRETLALTLVRGRWFDERAERAGVREVVVNEAAVARFFADEDPLGRRIVVSPPHWDTRPAEIVGIVRSVRNRGLVPEPAVRQIPARRQSQLYLVARGRTGTDGILDGVRSIVRELDPEQPVYAVSTLARQLQQGVLQRRAAAVLLAGFAALALVLASVGVYGVVSRAVLSRTREIGVRAALGAGRGALRRMIVADAVRPVVAGVLLGAALLYGGSRLVAAWVFGVRPELGPVLGAALVILAAGALASVAPAVRAGRIDPIEALRGE